MKASDIFGLLIRIVGMYLIVMGAWYFLYVVVQAAGLAPNQPNEIGSYVSGGIPFLLAGFALIRWARRIVRFTYPNLKSDSDSDDA